MQTTQLELETVTPMFLHGANSRNGLELRPPPFKALFRYWWRATQSITRSNDLREEEGKRFGKTGQKSPLLIRLSFSEELKKDGYQPLPHHTGGWDCGNCLQGEKPCRKNYSNDAYCPGQQFKVTLTANNVPHYASVAKLGFLLGGVGNRSRRGFGSVRETSWVFQDVPHLRSEILQTLDSVAGPRQFVDNGSSIVSSLTLLAYPVIREIFFGQPMYNDPVPLLKKIGQATHDHYDRHNNALGYARGQQRMASPIHIRIQKVGNNYIPIVTQLHWRYPEYTITDLHRQQAFIDQIIN